MNNKMFEQDIVSQPSLLLTPNPRDGISVMINVHTRTHSHACAHTNAHRLMQEHRRGGVFSTSEKERSPVARQPQPPFSLALCRLRGTNTGINCAAHLVPLCATCRPQAFAPRLPFHAQQLLQRFRCQTTVLKWSSWIIMKLIFTS